MVLVSHHIGRIAEQLLSGEGRRRQLAVALPEFALGGEDALAEYRREVPPDHPVLDEIAVILDEHLLDVVGIVKLDRIPAGEVVADDIAIGAGILRQKIKLTAPERQQTAEQGQPFWSGRPRKSSRVG
jgi:hypothetical protein